MKLTESTQNTLAATVGQSIGRRRNKTGMNKICCYHHASWSGFTSFRRTYTTGRYRGLTQIFPSFTVARYSSIPFHHSLLQNLPKSVRGGSSFGSLPMYSSLPGHLKCTHSLVSLEAMIPNPIHTVWFLIHFFLFSPLLSSSVSFQWLVFDSYVWRTKTMVHSHMLFGCM